MESGTGFNRNNRKTNFIKSQKGQETVESHDRQRREGTRHVMKNCVVIAQMIVRSERF